jgi:hypothetical protein
MLRLFNLALIMSLIGSATWAYSIKYETIYFAGKLKRLDAEIDRERDRIALLRADWQHLSQPSRIQTLSDRHLKVAPVSANQIIEPTQIPSKDFGEDLIGAKLGDLLGSTGSVPTPDQGRKTSGRTPGE